MIIDQNNEILGEFSFNEEEIRFKISDNEKIFFVGIPEPKAYIVVQKKDNYPFLIKFWYDSSLVTDEYIRELIKFAIDREQELYIDSNLDIQELIENIIENGESNVSIADLTNGSVMAYNPYKPENEYITEIKKNKWVWVLETRPRRTGILQEYVRFGPKIN